jgi:hypothetical protein
VKGTGNSWTRSFTYASAGNQTLSATVSDGHGLSSAAASRTVTIENDPPTASIACTPSPAHMGSSSTCTLTGTDPNGDAVSLASGTGWTAAGAGKWTQPVTLNQASGGSVSVSGAVKDAHGATSTTATATVSFTNAAPTASALSCNPASPTANQSFRCTATVGDTDSHDAPLLTASGWTKSTNTSYYRDYGPYTTPQTVSVSITVADPHGATATRNLSVTVSHKVGCTDSRATNYDATATQNSGCTYPSLSASMSCPASAHQGSAFTCTLSGSGGITPYTYSWGGTTKSFTGTTVGSYSAAGGTVTDAVGQTATAANRSVSITNTAPVATLTCPASAEAGQSFTCTLTGTDADSHDTALSAPNGWVKGTGNSWTRSFSYSTTGRQTISATVSDSHGLSSAAATRNVDIITSKTLQCEVSVTDYNDHGRYDLQSAGIISYAATRSGTSPSFSLTYSSAPSWNDDIYPGYTAFYPNPLYAQHTPRSWSWTGWGSGSGDFYGGDYMQVGHTLTINLAAPPAGAQNWSSTYQVLMRRYSWIEGGDAYWVVEATTNCSMK